MKKSAHVKTEVAAALAALDISKPYRFHSAPKFQPPEPIPVPAQDLKVPPQPEPALKSQAPLETRSTLHPKVEVTSNSRGGQEARLPADPRPTPDSVALRKPSKREVILKTPSGEYQVFQKKDLSARDLVPQLALSADGYGALSNRILEILYLADFDKVEHEILQFIIRESIFWRQEWTDPLSGADFEKRSGISSSSLWTHLKRLTDKGWVEKMLAKGSSKAQSSNAYRLNPEVWGSLLPKKKKDSNETKSATPLTTAFEVASESGGTPEINPLSPLGSEGSTSSANQRSRSLYEKHSLKNNLKTSLSVVEGFPAEFQKRWADMADQGKYERDLFKTLQSRYGTEVQEYCLLVVSDLETHGDLRQRAVASPFGLLAQGKNWETFLALSLRRQASREAVHRVRSLSGGSCEASEGPGVLDEGSSPEAGFFEAIRLRMKARGG